jgi:outer membrane protein assembly factor BamD
MNKHYSDVCRRLTAAGCVLLLLVAAGCAKKNKTPRVPPDPAVADQFLMERGREELAKKHYMEAREFFKQLVDNYSASPLRPAAKLAIADTYLGEASTESLVLAANEYREYMTFYPTDPKNDYAQYSVAMSYFKQMKKADRDQTATKEALAEFDTFFQRYPNSPLTPEVREKWRIARDRLSESSLDVGVGYFKRRWYPGAAERFNEVIREDPGFTHIDAVYYYLAETFARADRKGEAIPLFDRVVKEYKTGEYTAKAQKRLTELTAK